MYVYLHILSSLTRKVFLSKLYQIRKCWSRRMGTCIVDTPERIISTEIVDLPRTLAEAIRVYGDADIATRVLAQARWGDAIECLHCHSRLRHSYITTRRIWKCRQCRKQFSPKAGTIFEDSPMGLDRWLVAIWVVANNEKDFSSYRLRRL